MAPFRTALCTACGHGRPRFLYSVRGTKIWQCPSCGLATWDWQTFDFEAFYGQDYWKSSELGKGYADYFSLAPAMTRTHRKRLPWLKNYLSLPLGPPSSPPHLLDAGCGPGFFVQAAAEFGFDAYGVEISDFAARFAREELHQNVWQGRIEAGSLYPDSAFRVPQTTFRYDVVTLWDVIEHLPDPADSISALAEVIRPGGLLALSTGDVRSLAARVCGPKWHLFNLPEHLWFFTPASLRHILQRSGFDVMAWHYEVCWYSLRYLAERCEAAFRLRRVISPNLGRLENLPLPVTLLDIVTVLARRR